MRDNGILPRDSVARRVDREMFLILGGSAALLMQLAHPLVAAGVARHSDFREDPVGRLRRTLDLTLAVVFGDRATAERALARIDRRHESVTGVAPDGRAYRAREPHLLLWIEATLVLTSLRLYELVLGPLAPPERERYWDESKPIASALGIPEAMLPATLAHLERYEVEALAAEVVPDPLSRELGRAVLRPFPWIPDLAHRPLDALTAGLLPPALRGPFGLRFRTRDRLLFRAMIVALRLARRVLPDRLTVVPQARRFERRTREAADAR